MSQTTESELDTTLRRYQIAKRYLDNQTDEGWQRLLGDVAEELDAGRQALGVKLYDGAAGPVIDPDTHPQVLVRIGDSPSGFLELCPVGYGDFSTQDGWGSPVALEYYNGELRLIVYPDINDQEPVVIGLEGARESKRLPEQ